VQEARHVLILARSLFAHAVALQHVKHNPAKDIALKSIGAPGERDRALTRDELRQFLAALNAATFLNPTHVLAMRLLLLTLCRKGELVKAWWEHVDFDARTWTALNQLLLDAASPFNAHHLMALEQVDIAPQ